EAARLAPAEQILVETDAPYMTPEPFRGARNEPGFVGYTARVLAEARGQSPAEFAELAWADANRIFGLEGEGRGTPRYLSVRPGGAIACGSSTFRPGAQAGCRCTCDELLLLLQCVFPT